MNQIFTFTLLTSLCLLQLKQVYSQGTCTCTLDTDDFGRQYCRSATINCDANVADGPIYLCPCTKYTVTDCPLSSTEACLDVTSYSLDPEIGCECKSVAGSGVCFSGFADQCDLSQGQICTCNLYPSSSDCTDYGATPARCLFLASIQGDPHFVGFDGIKYDFHGLNAHHYLIYAEKNGDVLVAKTRSTPELYHGINKTYFEEFGLQTVGFNNHIHFFIQKLDKESKLKVSLNGKTISSKTSLKESTIDFDKRKNRVIVITRNNRITISGTSIKSRHRRHLDFEISKIKKVEERDRFSGILGMTLSRKLGSKIHEHVLKNKQPVELERTLRKHYTVNNLYPKRDSLNPLFEM